MLSEPWLAIHNLACLNRAYEEGARERSPQEEGGRGEDLRREGGGSEDEEGEDEDEESHFHQSRMEEERRESTVNKRVNRCEGGNYNSCQVDFLPRVSQSVLSLTEMSLSQGSFSRPVHRRCLMPRESTLDKTTQKHSVNKLPVCPSPHSQLRRNTLPSVTVVPPLLHLPPLVSQSDSRLQVPTRGPLSKIRSMVFLPHPPCSSTPSSSSSSSAASARPALLPPLPVSPSVASLVAPAASCCGERSRRSPRRHSVQLEQIRGGEHANHPGLRD